MVCHNASANIAFKRMVLKYLELLEFVVVEQEPSRISVFDRIIIFPEKYDLLTSIHRIRDRVELDLYVIELLYILSACLPVV